MNRRDAIRSTCALAGASMLSGFHPVAEAFDRVGVSRVEPFRINFGRERIEDLHRRIEAMIWPEMPFDTGWSAGTSDTVLKDLARYWRHEYDWFKVQDRLNELDHFRTPIEGERLHFVHYRGTGRRQRIPILLLHGWPSSFVEFTDAAPLLVQGLDGEPGFDLVVPSLPGFVFSDAPQKPGLHPGRIADRLHRLMRTLGYDRYGVQGGDWGWVIGINLARQYPDAVAGAYLLGAPWQAPGEGQTPTEQEKAFLDRWNRFTAEEMAYWEIQVTKPQTLAYAQQDSPVGLLAWMLEKFWAWTDHGEDLWEALDREKVLTTATLYWLTGRVLSSARIYYEFRTREEDSSGPVTVPVWFAPYPKDPWSPPRSLFAAGEFVNVAGYTEPPAGGHFPALEVPEFWARDVAAFFAKL